MMFVQKGWVSVLFYINMNGIRDDNASKYTFDIDIVGSVPLSRK